MDVYGIEALLGLPEFRLIEQPLASCLENVRFLDSRPTTKIFRIYG
jgi:hypothetical protein